MGRLGTFFVMLVGTTWALSACGGADPDPVDPQPDTTSTMDVSEVTDAVTPEDTGTASDGTTPQPDAEVSEPEASAHDTEDASVVEVEEPDVGEPPGPGPGTLNCDEIPQGPFELVKLDGPLASEDLAFDRLGHLVGSNDNAIFKSPYSGSPQVWVPNIEFRAGLRFLPTGDLVVNNDETGQLL
ncbi:MAG: hypothetical protein QF464_16375, partial [Myxococcota bacterium]|nr:hypothetical protein [Myxococcota bacterium]